MKNYKPIGRLPLTHFVIYWLKGAPSFVSLSMTEEDAKSRFNDCINGNGFLDGHRLIFPQRMFLCKIISDDYVSPEIFEKRISKNNVLDACEKDSFSTANPGFRSSTHCLNSSKKSDARSSKSKVSLEKVSE